jgi:hypothetical protein
MPGKRRVSAIHPTYRPSSKLRKPTSKELDLLLLAGCSCLLTVLYHPVAHALQSHGAQSSSSAIAQTSTTSTSNSTNAFHLVVPSRDEVTEEEEN